MAEDRLRIDKDHTNLNIQTDNLRMTIRLMQNGSMKLVICSNNTGVIIHETMSFMSFVQGFSILLDGLKAHGELFVEPTKDAVKVEADVGQFITADEVLHAMTQETLPIAPRETGVEKAIKRILGKLNIKVIESDSVVAGGGK